jgi:uncharacterized protein (TIGR02246 family)
MVRGGRLGWVLALSLAAAGASGADGPAAEVAALERQWAQAQVKADVALLGRIYADDIVYVHSSGDVDTRARLLERVGGGSLRYQKLELVDPRVRVYGDAAVVNGAFDVVVQVDGQPVNHRVLYVHVYARQGGTWRMVAHQTTKAPGQ